MNAALCPTTEEQEKGAVPRWQRSVPAADGAFLEEGSQQTEQMPGAAPLAEAGLEEQLGTWAPPRPAPAAEE